NAGFSLPGNGGAIFLFNPNSQVADSVAFGPQPADLSIGKNAGTWNLLSGPTPGAANAASAALGDPANLRVHEWIADPAGGEDWFALYNPDTLPVSLSGLFLPDDPSATGTTNFPVPALSFTAGHGWVEYHADGHPSQGPDHVNFSMDKDGETVRVYSGNL